MKFSDYYLTLPTKRKLSDVKQKILTRLWHSDDEPFPKPWVSSDELLALTEQKYFDRRTRELREKLGCDLESSYRKEFNAHAWRLKSSTLSSPKVREYLTEKQKQKLFSDSKYMCAVCGCEVEPGLRGLQADHKVPVQRGGGNELSNWQPLCVTCNVGKRRACEGCELDCSICSWAYPDKVGIRSIFMIETDVVTKLNEYIKTNQMNADEVVTLALEHFLSRSTAGD